MPSPSGFPGPMPTGPGILYPNPRPRPPINFPIIGPIKYGPPTLAPPGITPAPTPTPTTTGTPVPSGFPTNQFFVAPDGSVWEYSVTANKWFNTGTPYNVGAPPPIAPTDTSAPAPPVSVSVTTPPPADTTGYQSILNWLTQQNLITNIPNWMVLAGAAVAYKMFFATQSAGRGH